MQVTHSFTAIAPLAAVDSANAFFDNGFGWGSPVFTVPLSANGALPVTHMGLHTYVTAEFAATLGAAKASDDPELDALDAVFLHAVEAESSKFHDAIGGLNGSTIVADLGSTLQVYSPPFEM